MSRISDQDSSSAANAASEAQKHAEAQRAEIQHASTSAQGNRNNAKFAALYRGTTNFTYGSDARHAATIRSLNTKRMAAQLARRRALLRKRRKGAEGGEESGGDDYEATHDTSHRVPRDGGEGGKSGSGESGEHGNGTGSGKARKRYAGNKNNGRTSGKAGIRIAFRSVKNGNGDDRGEGQGQGQGRNNDQSTDKHDVDEVASFRVSSRKTVGQYEGKLNAVAQQFVGKAEDSRCFQAVNDARARDLLDLLGDLQRDPGMRPDARILEHSIDLLMVQQLIGRLPAAGLGAFIDYAKSRRSSRRQPPAPGGQASFERLRDAHFLAPLLWMKGDRPSTARRRDRELATLASMHAAALSAQAHPGAAPASIPDKE
jgi:type III secretion regulatory protein HpaA